MTIESLEKYINEAVYYNKRSPLYQTDSIPSTMPRDFLEVYNGKLINYLEKIRNPLKVVIIGEVKAGKSTLINALVGQEVAPTNVLEATAVIMEIVYSEEAYAVIHGDKDVRGTIDEIFSTLDLYQQDQNDPKARVFFEQISYVSTYLQTEKLKELHIVDTPGLATITEANESLTKNYIESADVVLWVINGNYLGQSDINEKIEMVYDIGKPIIGVINRVDEVDGDPQELVDYLEDTMGIYFEEIFPLSAYRAFNGIKRNDFQETEESGYNILVDYLTTEIERQEVKVKMDSVYESVRKLIVQYKSAHTSYVTDLNSLKEAQEQFDEKIKSAMSKVRAKIDLEIEHWRNSFLRKEEAELKSMVENLDFIKTKDSVEQINNYMLTHLTEDMIRVEMEALYGVLKSTFEVEWSKQMIVLKKEMNDIILELNRNKALDNSRNALSLDTEDSEALAGVRDGAIASGVLTTALAGYAAWLGPYAASVSFGAAFGAIFPPVLLAGAVVGGLIKVFTFKNQKKLLSLEVATKMDNIRLDYGGAVEREVSGKIDEQNQGIYRDMMDNFNKIPLNGFSGDELSHFIRKMNQFIVSLDTLDMVVDNG